MSRMVVKGLFKGGKSSLDSTQGCLPFVFFVCVWGFTTCMEGPYGFFGMVVHVFQWLCVVVIFNIWYGYFYMCLMVVLWMLLKSLCQGVVCANFLRSRSAEVGRGQPRSAKVGRGEPRWAEVGQGGPRSAELGRGGPRWAEVSRGGPRSAEVGRGQPIMTKLLKSY